jgi:hypothetical protein
MKNIGLKKTFWRVTVALFCRHLALSSSILNLGLFSEQFKTNSSSTFRAEQLFCEELSSQVSYHQLSTQLNPYCCSDDHQDCRG